MERRAMGWLAVVLSLGVVLAAVVPAMSQEVPRISKEDLKEMLGKPDVVIVDVRAGSDWNASTFKVKGAVREEADKVDSWIEKYSKDKTLVLLLSLTQRGNQCPGGTETHGERLYQSLCTEGRMARVVSSQVPGGRKITRAARLTQKEGGLFDCVRSDSTV